METTPEIDIKKLIKDGLSEKSVVRRLVQNGYSESDAHEHYIIALEALQDSYTLKYRFVWLAILLISSCLCFLILPMNVTGNSPVFIGILGGLLLSLGIIQTIEVFDSFSSFWQTFMSSDYHRKPKVHIAIMFFIPIVLSAGLSIFYNWEVGHELETRGVDTWATIIEAERLTPVNDSNTVSGPVSHRIRISFKPKDSEDFIEKYCFVSDLQFINAHLGSPVAVRYSPRYPEFFEVNLESLNSEKPSRNIEIIEDGGTM